MFPTFFFRFSYFFLTEIRDSSPEPIRYKQHCHNVKRDLNNQLLGLEIRCGLTQATVAACNRSRT